MKAADPHRDVGHAQSDVGCAEAFIGIARPLAAEVHEPVERHADLFQVGPEQLVAEPGVEVVAARGHGRVRGEDDAGAGHQAGLLERELPGPPQLQHPLQRDQEAMALVHVEDRGLDAQGAKRPHAADAEHDLLSQPAFGLGHVQAVADRAQLGRVGLDVGVEQEERHPAHLHAPDGDPDPVGADRRIHFHRRPVR